MASNQSIDDVLATEIKKEIAGRYFSFRKLIEEDTMDLKEKVRQYSFILEKRISFDLIRIYILLKEDELIQEFLAITNLDQKLFYDPYLTESPNIAQRVFECQNFTGFTRSGRFKKYLLTCYDNLFFHTEIYRKKIAELQSAQDLIVEEIKQFYSNNDLNTIMSFLNTLGSQESCGCMQGGMEIGMADGLDKKLRIKPPLPIEQVMTVLPPLKSLEEIKGKLKKLAVRAYSLQSPELLEMFSRSKTPCDHRN